MQEMAAAACCAVHCPVADAVHEPILRFLHLLLQLVVIFLKRIADSSSKCNFLAWSKEQLFQRVEAEKFPWPVVEIIHDQVDVLLTQHIEISSFWQILPYKPVRIFIKSPFLSLIRMSKEAFSLKSCREFFMKSKFPAVVARYGMNLFLMQEQRSGKGLCDTVRPFVRRKGNNAETGLPLN